MKKEDIYGYILVGIIGFGLLFWLFIMPITVAYGVITGKLNIETLEPRKAQEQVIDETMMYGGFDVY